MKATGTIRRIDDLGRVVIPKEIRRQMRIHEGDPLELNQIDGGVLFKRYSSLGVLEEESDALLKAMINLNGANIVVIDTTNVLAHSNCKMRKEYGNIEISDECEQLLLTKMEIRDSEINIADGKNGVVKLLLPILSSGEVMGALVVIDSNITEEVYSQIKYMANILKTRIEEV